MKNLGPINKYGYFSIAIFGAIFIFSLIFGIFAWFFGVLFLVSLFIYQNPEREPQNNDKRAIFSPIDGRVISVEKSVYLGDEFLEVIIQNSILNSGALRSVADAKIGEIRTKFGLNLHSANAMKNLLNNRVAYICEVLGKKIIIKICGGALSRKIYHEKAEILKAGARFGFIVDGRVSLLLPTDTTLKILKNDSVKACETIGFLNG